MGNVGRKVGCLVLLAEEEKPDTRRSARRCNSRSLSSQVALMPLAPQSCRFCVVVMSFLSCADKGFAFPLLFNRRPVQLLTIR